MRRLLFLGLFLLPSMCFGQSLLRVQKFCEVGNQSVTTQGLASLTKVQRSFPLCLVTVYQSGTTNLASLFSDNLPSPTVLANPFTANVDGSFGFYAAPGACYDVVTSGAGFPAPFTYSYICLNSGGGGGGGGAVNCITALNGSMAAFHSPISLGCDQNAGTDFFGNIFGQSFSALGPVNGFFSLIGGGSSPGTNVKFKLPINTFRWLAPASMGTSLYTEPPSTSCSVGQTWDKTGQTTDGNGDIVDKYGCLTMSPLHGISFTIYNSGGLASGSTTASTDYVTVPFPCTIQAYNLAIDSGTITVKFWKIATGTAIPTVSNSISVSGVAIASGTAIHSTTLSDFTTTTVTANDILAMNITAASGPTYVNGVLQCQ